ncbi:MAG: hypothetical protein M0Z75_16685 [Nitrospiraceae bacterium]|nr:hypothetical protein [Nitrospiraceae bacterium]
MLLLAAAAVIFAGGCNSGGTGGPKDTLDKYFGSAVRQDYGEVYDCYYGAYKAKVSRQQYIRHRLESAKTLKDYRNCPFSSPAIRAGPGRCLPSSHRGN